MMPEIVVREFNGGEITRRAVAAGETFADAGMREWPEGFPGSVPLIQGPDGKYVVTRKAISEPMEDGQEWTVVLRPQAVLFGAAALTFLGVTVGQWALLAVSLAASFLLAPKIPDATPSLSYEWADDSPQWMSGQNNQLRPGRRIPDIFGKVRTYPDLIAPAAIEYSGTEQIIRELYVVGRGHYNVSDLQFHDEEFGDVPNSNYTVHYPGQPFPTGFPIMRTNAFVGAIELPGPNEQISYGFTWQIRTAGHIFVDADGYWDEFLGTVGSQFMLLGVNGLNTLPQTVTGISADGKYLYVNPPFQVNEDHVAGTAYFSGLSYISSDGANNPRTYALDWNKVRVYQGQSGDEVLTLLGYGGSKKTPMSAGRRKSAKRSRL